LREYPPDRIAEAADGDVGWRFRLLAITIADQHRAAPGAATCLDVAPPIAYHKALGQSDPIAFGGSR